MYRVKISLLLAKKQTNEKKCLSSASVLVIILKDKMKKSLKSGGVSLIRLKLKFNSHQIKSSKYKGEFEDENYYPVIIQ